MFSRALKFIACVITGAMSSEAAANNISLVDQIHFYQVCVASIYHLLDLQAAHKLLIKYTKIPILSECTQIKNAAG